MEDTEDCKMDRNRFQQIYSQGKLNVMEIWVDKETSASGENNGHEGAGTYAARYFLCFCFFE